MCIRDSTKTNQSVIARSAMAMANKGKEPSYSTLVADNPKATRNPVTNRPVDKRRIFKILRKRCYDDPKDKSDTWEYGPVHSKEALTEQAIKQRDAWARRMLKIGFKPKWCFKNHVWIDICNSILPRTEQKAQEQMIARKGGRRWRSSKTRKQSKNLKGNKSALRQQSHGNTLTVWWAPILARGKLHIEILGDTFPGENSEGAAILVRKVRHVLNARFPNQSQPSVLCTDRGQGFTP